jgi:hypothetical protein
MELPMSNKKTKMKGLYNKYIVLKANGKPVDPKAQYVVLRVDGGQYVHACRAGVAAFGEAVREKNPILADDIQNLLRIEEK